MDDEIRTLRRVLAGMKRGQGRRYAAELKGEIGRVARGRRARGDSWQAIAMAIGIPHETVRRFAIVDGDNDGRSGSDAFVAVEVSAASARHSPLVVTTRDGIRIEGLDVETAAELVRRLS
jgi:hypothetical protein